MRVSHEYKNAAGNVTKIECRGPLIYVYSNDVYEGAVLMADIVQKAREQERAREQEGGSLS